jgi:hypothetical protein
MRIRSDYVTNSSSANLDSFNLRQFSMNEVWTQRFAYYRRIPDRSCGEDCKHSPSCHGK